jgi:hypothetical protein
MKRMIVTISLATAAALVTACQSSENAASRWSDMQVDIAMRRKYEKYACGYHLLTGYSKETASVGSRRVATPVEPASKKPERVLVNADNHGASSTQQNADRVNELSQKIDVLEEALKSNVAVTNQNQNLLVEQINALKTQIAALQQKPEVASPTLASGIHIP